MSILDFIKEHQKDMYLFEDVYKPSQKEINVNPSYGLQILQSDDSS